jgi:hypothetical protein
MHAWAGTPQETQRAAWALIPTRACGTCTVCCTVPAIDDDIITKAPNTACRHCADTRCTGTGHAGCAVYETRPKVCRDFYCAWRLLPDIPETWRPDRVQVFALLDDVNIPGHGITPALTLMLTGNPLQTVRQHWFQAYVRARALTRQPIYLALPGKPGTKPLRAALPISPLHAAAQRGTAEVKAMLEQALKVLSTAPLVPFTFTRNGVDVGDR